MPQNDKFHEILAADSILAQQWFSISTDQNNVTIQLSDLQWVIDSVPQGNGLFGVIFIGSSENYPSLVVNLG